MPIGPSVRTLVIFDGGVPSLVAALMGGAPADIRAWVPPPGAPCTDGPRQRMTAQRAALAARLAGLVGAASVEQPGTLAWPAPGASHGLGAALEGVQEPSAAAVLLLACEHAITLGCEAVVWPVVCGDDLDLLSEVAEAAELAGRLVCLLSGTKNKGKPEITVQPMVDIPLADLNDQQVAEMALDLDAPVGECWWALAGGGAASDEARWRWEGALQDAASVRGYPLPATR